jgi:hypothetical protein
LDQYVIKEVAFDDLKTKTGLKYTATSFKKKLQAYSKYNEWVFNPQDAKGYQVDGRIMQKVDNETKEMFYIRTTGAKASEAIKQAQVEFKEAKDDIEDELPF